jgi:hypothetical protein
MENLPWLSFCSLRAWVRDALGGGAIRHGAVLRDIIYFINIVLTPGCRSVVEM